MLRVLCLPLVAALALSAFVTRAEGAARAAVAQARSVIRPGVRAPRFPFAPATE